MTIAILAVTLVVTVLLDGEGNMLLFEDKIKLPLAMEGLQKVLELKGKKQADKPSLNQDVMAIVSLKDSTLKGAHFISYVSNLKLSIALDYEGVSKEDKFELLKSYLNSRMLSEISSLIETTMVVLIENKGAEIEGSFFLDRNERKEFITEHIELIEKYELFLESILLGLPFCIKEYASTIGKDLIDNNSIQVVNDPAYISSNVVSLILEEGFIESYLAMDLKHAPKFFDSQWFEPVFNGFSLVSIVSQHCTLFPFLQSMYEGWFTEDEFKAAREDSLSAVS